MFGILIFTLSDAANQKESTGKPNIETDNQMEKKF